MSSLGVGRVHMVSNRVEVKASLGQLARENNLALVQMTMITTKMTQSVGAKVLQILGKMEEQKQVHYQVEHYLV